MKKLLLTVLATAPVACAIAAVPAGQLWSQQVPEGIREARRLPKSYAPKATETESIDFTMAFKVNEALTFGDSYIGREIWQAFYFSPEMATMYAGGEVTAVNITTGENLTSGTNGVTRVTAYLMEELGDGAFREQSGKLGFDAYTSYPIALDQPYEIEAGKGFYVAYKCSPASRSDYYIPVDGVPRSEGGGCYIGLLEKGSITWGDYASDFGNLNMGITIQSDNLPRNGVNLFNVAYPEVVYPGEAFTMEVSLAGATVNPAENIELQYQIADEAPVTIPVELESPLQYGEYTTLRLQDIKTSKIGANMAMELSVVKVNGEANVAAEGKRILPLTCLGDEMGYLRRFVVEEGTGTWCVWCPAGIVVMEYLKSEYPDQFIRIALHGNDEMTVQSIDAPLSMFSAFPMMMIDRQTMVAPSAEAFSILDRYDATYASVPAIGEVSSISTKVNVDKRELNVDAEIRFAVPVSNNGRYGMAYYITEDGVGPYLQQNAYSGGENGAMGGWEYEPEYVPTIYDDVAREYVGGLTGLDQLPSEIEAEKLYTCSQTLSLANVTKEDFYVTVMIIDNMDGSVLNATQIRVNDPSGVEGIAADGNDVAVIGSNGKIAIKGVYAAASVYDMEGRKVAEFGGSDEISVAAGFYIVNVDGKAFKVIVK